MIEEADRQRIAAAIGRAEANTAGEIVCVLARASSDYIYVPLLWGSFLALLAPWGLFAFTPWRPWTILSAQVLVFIACVIAFSWPPLRRLLTPRAVMRTRAFRAAMEQFHMRGVTRTPNRMGVMIFVSMEERYARIVADVGIDARVEDRQWRETVAILTGHIREGRIADGFVAAIDDIGALLARHAPPDGTGDTLPDRLFIV